MPNLNRETDMNKQKVITRKILFVLIILFSLFAPFVSSQQDIIRGTVKDKNGKAVKDGVIEVYFENTLIQKVLSDNEGAFAINLEPGQYLLVIWSDKPDTAGFDYFPEKIIVNVPSEEFVIELEPAASIIIDHEFQVVETENLPLDTQYEIVSKEFVEITSVPLLYGQRAEGVGDLLRLYPKHILVPLNYSYKIRVSSTFLVRNDLRDYEFIIENLTELNQGELVHLDIRKYSIPLNFQIIDEVRVKQETKLIDLESKGFYLSKQRDDLSRADLNILEARKLFNVEAFDDSFESSKRGYISMVQTISELDSMHRDASTSVYILISFLTLTSFAMGYLLIDSKPLQYFVDLLIFIISLIILHFAYPGSKIINIESFVASSIINLIGLFLIIIIGPNLWKGSRSNDYVKARNLIRPIFNIAKRNLIRRKLRFFLTLISLTLLVMSFVTLTSFNEGYGIISSRLQKPISSRGAMIKASNWKNDEPVFLEWTKIEQDWLASHTETLTLSPKVENIPRKSPITLFNGQEIWGIIGITERETEVLDLTMLNVEKLDSGILVSKEFSKSIGVGVGSTLSFAQNDLTIVGIFDDKDFSRLVDLDGERYAPMKWVNINSEGYEPMFTLEPCEPHEIIIMFFEEALSVMGTGVERVAIKVLEEDALTFAESLTLERGYRTWASTREGIQEFRLGNYFESRGLNLIVPWVIVVLNVIIIMHNNLFERKNDIKIFSSVGLNPAHISALFLVEATIIGFIAGGLGYLFGLIIYKGLNVFNLAIQVQQKVSAFWSLAAIGISILTVLTGAYFALQSSVIITPSLTRRWRIEKERVDTWNHWEVIIPVKLSHEEGNGFVEFILKRLRSLENGVVRKTSRIKYTEEGENLIVKFIYKSTQTTTNNFYTSNFLILRRSGKGEYEVILESKGAPEWAHATGSLIRQFTMEYSTRAL
jgi:hypothetical protein